MDTKRKWKRGIELGLSLFALFIQGCSLLIGVQPTHLHFKSEEIELGLKKELRIWSKFPGTELKMHITPTERWVVVEPEQIISTGPWDRRKVEVGINTSVLPSLDALSLDACIEIRCGEGYRCVKVKVKRK